MIGTIPKSTIRKTAGNTKAHPATWSEPSTRLARAPALTAIVIA